MLRKNVFSLFVALLMMVVVPAAFAQSPMAQIPQEYLDLLAKEPPLAQKDIDTFIKMLPKVVTITDPAAGAKLIEESGFTEVRFALVNSKVPLAMAMSDPNMAKAMKIDDIPAPLRPTDAEIKLVKANEAALNQAQQDAMKAAMASSAAASEGANKGAEKK